MYVQTFEPDVQRLLRKCLSGGLDSLQRPVPPAVGPQQPTANSIRYVLSSANKLASRAAADLQSLQQEQQGAVVLAEQLAVLSQQAAELAQSGLKLQVQTEALSQQAADGLAQAFQETQQANNAGGSLEPAAAAAANIDMQQVCFVVVEWL